MKRETPPDAGLFHDVDLEAALLGGLLLNNSALSTLPQDFNADSFGEDLHRRIFSEAKRLIEAGQQADPLTVLAAMPRDLKIAGNMTLAQYLAALAGSATTLVPAYAATVRGFAYLRQGVEALQDLRDARQHFKSPDVALAEFFDRVDALRVAYGNSRNSAPAESIGVVGDAVLNHINDQAAGRLKPGVMTGLTRLDGLLGGFRPGQLILVGGRPGVGKTTIGASLARGAAKNGHATAFYSLEMQRRDIGARFLTDEAADLSPHGAIAYQHILYAQTMKQEIYERLEDAKRSLARLPLEIDCSSALTVGELGSKIRALKLKFARQEKPLAAVFVDYLKFLKASDRYRGHRVLEIGEISGGLKQLAKDEDVPIVLLVQLNREVEKREEKRPQLSDLRDSGELEQDADVVIFVHRDAYYMSQEQRDARPLDDYKVMDVIISKQRQGPLGNFKAYCNMATGSVRNLGYPGRASQVETPPPPSEDEMDFVR